jgi:Protein of unknown function (DUF2786)/SprT-like family
LRRPTLELSDTSARLGRWVKESRRIELSRALLVRHGWGILVEVLKHEMAHQFVDEVLGAADETAHGATFRKVCDERSIDARAAGLPDAGRAPHHAPVLERIAKLLALAESSNQHEAQAAMNAAQRLMLKHNLDELGVGRPQACSYRHLGAPTGRVSEAERILANILSEHFFIDAIWVPVWRPREAKRGSVLEICGRLENLEMAEYVYAFLLQTSARLWEEHKKSLGMRQNRDRRAYVAGVMAGFRQELELQSRRNAKEGLVWVGDPEVGDYFQRRHPRVRWTRHVSSRGSSAHEHGVAAGRRIVLHRGMKTGPSGPVRLLKAR